MLEHILHDDHIYSAPDWLQEQANLQDLAGEHARSLKDPTAFWGAWAERFAWFQPWQQVMDWQYPNHQWFVGGQTNITLNALDRHAGYKAALKQAGLKLDPALVVMGDYTEAAGLLAVNRLLDAGNPFTAIFAANDQMAIGAALGLYRRGVRVPDDVSLVGFDDLAPAKFAIPPLTTVRQSVYEMGDQAASAMLDLLRGEAPQVALPPPQLVPRESTRRLQR